MDPAILIVDDDHDLLRMLGRYFASHPFRVSCVATLGDARAHIERGTYHAVITDVRLGDSDDQGGLELVCYTRFRSPDSVVIVHTAHLTDEIRRTALELGADVVLQKQIPLRALEETVIEGIRTHSTTSNSHAVI